MSDDAESALQATKELVTFGIAVLGAGLGILNFWRAVAKDRVRLRVTPSIYFGEGVSGLGIEVVNVGFVPVTVQNISVEIGKSKEWYYHIPRLSEGARLPHRLEPRESITAFLPPDADQEPRMADVRCAFAKTACGLYFRGKSSAFRSWKKKVRSTIKAEKLAGGR